MEDCLGLHSIEGKWLEEVKRYCRKGKFRVTRLKDFIAWEYDGEGGLVGMNQSTVYNANRSSLCNKKDPYFSLLSKPFSEPFVPYNLPGLISGIPVFVSVSSFAVTMRNPSNHSYLYSVPPALIRGIRNRK